jgi:replicative DNA helicase Mcm
MYVPQERGKRIEPFECENGVCGRRGPWKLDVANSKVIASQDVILESTEGDVHLSVILDEPLCTSNVWERDAKIVRVVGTLGMMEFTEKNKIETNFVLQANSIELAEESAVPPSTEEEIQMFEDWAGDPVELRKKLINNIAPNLYGLNDEKDALCLSLFSDWTWKLPAEKTQIRSSLHILLIGDPGVGKSDLIKDAVKHAPKGILGQGENATGKGLSNAATQENGIWVIKAGLFAKGDGGIIGLDELDKIDPKERNSLHSILVAQKQVVDKAGKHVEFDTRCAALCAANPKNGHIDRYEPIIKQLGFTSTIFQRFDLVFVLIDRSDSEKDSKIYHKISESCNNSPLGDIALERAIPLETYKKYVLYARTKPVPDMTPEADELLEQFYLHARSRARKEGIGGTDYPAISHRSAGALIKIAKCIARRELATRVTPEHAQYAIALYRKSIISVGMGEEDLMCLETGGTGSQFKRIKDITESLMGSKNTGKILKEISNETGYPLSEVVAILERMKTNGEVMVSGDIYRWVGK